MTMPLKQTQSDTAMTCDHHHDHSTCLSSAALHTPGTERVNNANGKITKNELTTVRQHFATTKRLRKRLESYRASLSVPSYRRTTFELCPAAPSEH